MVAGTSASLALATPPPAFHDLVDRARAMADAPYSVSATPIPATLAAMNYDDYKAIAFRNDAALWRGTSSLFQAQFFHPGYLFTNPVTITVKDGDAILPVTFSPDLFVYARHLELGPIPRDLGLAGVRFTYPLHDPAKFDEVLSFLGASYFRGVGRHQHYGLSARGLAIDTATDRPEEFPGFTEFLLVRPPDGATTLQLGAVLDSPAVAGAYWFEVTPGDDLISDVTAELFFRHGVTKVGVAPLTSMFWRGEGDARAKKDLRGEVHDSDGLALHAGDGEWIWRPLHNPRDLYTTRLNTHDPRGFGLLQRDRHSLSYNDPLVRMETRPSAWIEPLEPWGAGAVELVEVPTNFEYFDNIVAYWVPANPVVAGTHLVLRYRLRFGGETAATPPASFVTQTRRHASSPSTTNVRIDWSPIADSPDDEIPLQAIVTGTGATIADVRVERHRQTGGATVRFDLNDVQQGRAIDLRAYLKRGEEAVSETWSMSWQP